MPTLPVGMKSSINHNLTEIVELHEEILGEMHRVVPHSEYTQLNIQKPWKGPASHGAHRWRNLDSVPEDDYRVSWLQMVPGMVADPQVAGEVAKVFGKKVRTPCWLHWQLATFH